MHLFNDYVMLELQNPQQDGKTFYRLSSRFKKHRQDDAMTVSFTRTMSK
jgi:hypothetical protein